MLLLLAWYIISDHIERLDKMIILIVVSKKLRRIFGLLLWQHLKLVIQLTPIFLPLSPRFHGNLFIFPNQ